MTILADIPELDAKGLRRFAFTVGILIAGLFGLLLPWLLAHDLPLWPWVLGGILAIWGLVAPSTLRPVYRGWMRFGLVLNRIVSPLVLGLIYYLVVTPAGAFRRILGGDPMKRSFERPLRSYRVRSRKQRREKMEKPF